MMFLSCVNVLFVAVGLFVPGQRPAAEVPAERTGPVWVLQSHDLETRILTFGRSQPDSDPNARRFEFRPASVFVQGYPMPGGQTTGTWAYWAGRNGRFVSTQFVVGTRASPRALATIYQIVTLTNDVLVLRLSAQS